MSSMRSWGFQSTKIFAVGVFWLVNTVEATPCTSIFHQLFSRDPHRVVAVTHVHDLRFEFSKSGKSDRVILQDKSKNEEILYEGTLTRVPVYRRDLKEFFNIQVRLPRAISQRMKKYYWNSDPDDQGQDRIFAIGVRGGSLFIRFVRSYYPEAGYALSHTPVSTFFIPREYPQILSTKFRFLEEKGPERSTARYLIVVIKETPVESADQIKDWVQGIRRIEVEPKLWEPLVSGKPVNEEHYYGFGKQPENVQSWLIRLARPISWDSRVPAHDSERLFVSSGLSKFIGNGDYSAFSDWKIERNRLYLHPASRSLNEDEIEMSNPDWRHPLEIDLGRD